MVAVVVVVVDDQSECPGLEGVFGKLAPDDGVPGPRPALCVSVRLLLLLLLLLLLCYCVTVLLCHCIL